MIKVPLGGKAKGTFALVDDADAWVLDHSWCLDSGGYVAGRVNGRTQRLHKVLMGGGRSHVDHVNRDKLDNRRANLRLGSAAQNAANMRPRAGRLRGANYRRDTGRWSARVHVNGRHHYLGCTEAEAARVARDFRLAFMPGAQD